MPKVDISGQIKSSLIAELGDKSWKIRGESLAKVRRSEGGREGGGRRGREGGREKRRFYIAG